MSNTSTNPILTTAMRMASTGYKVFPIIAGTKKPAIKDWPTLATNNEIEILKWFKDTGHHLGWAMGVQPSGKNLFTLDIDGEDGWDSMNVLMMDDDAAAFSLTASQLTPTVPGSHYVFEAPFEVRNSTSQFADHVDIRGEGGFIVCAPTPGYEWEWPPWGAHKPLMAPEWVLDKVRQPAPSAPSKVVASSNGGDHPGDWVRDNMSIAGMLEADGWSSTGHGGEWTRPGKEAREGHSAVLHDPAPLVIWSTNAPQAYLNLGKPNADGSVSLSPLDVLAASAFGGDVTAAMSHVRKTLMPKTAAAPEPGRSEAAELVEGTGSTALSLNLPDEFWEARDYLTAIRQGAHHMICSGEAALGGVLTRYAAKVHPSIVLPQMGTLDLFAMIVGHSGSGKSKAVKTSRSLVPIDVKGVEADQPFGSGQGLIEGFFAWRDEEGNPCSPKKADAQKVRVLHGMHYAADEGVAITATAQQQGSILIPTLCAAWMGETLGQRNAQESTSRVIGPMQVRFCATINIQTINGNRVFRDEYAATGLSQRMICFTALDETLVEGIQPEWPGELDLPIPSIITGRNRVVEVHPEITAEVVTAIRQGHSPTWAGDPLDTHRNLSRLKVATLLALMDGRFDVNLEDWALSGMVLDSSDAVRDTMKWASQAGDARHTEAIGVARAAEESAVDRVGLADCIEVLRGRIREDRSIKKRDLTPRLKPFRDAACIELEKMGLVVLGPKGYSPK